MEGLFNEARHDQEAAHKGEFVQGRLVILIKIKMHNLKTKEQFDSTKNFAAPVNGFSVLALISYTGI